MIPLKNNYCWKMGILALCLGCGQSLQQEQHGEKVLAASQKGTIVAGEVIQRVKGHLTCPWESKTVDTFKSARKRPRSGNNTLFATPALLG